MPSVISFLYHEVTDNPDDSGFIKASALPYKHGVDEFNRNIDVIMRAGSTPCLVTDLRPDQPGDQLLMTFDDGGKSALAICDILDKQGWRGHFFITTNMIGNATFLNHGEIRDIHQRGHIIGSHSHTHATPFSSLSYAQMCEEWQGSKRILEDIIGSDVTTASVPGGDMNSETVRSAYDSGIKFLFTSEPRKETESYADLLVLGRICPKTGTSLKEIEKFSHGHGFKKAQAIRHIKNIIRALLGPIYTLKEKRDSASHG